MSQYDFKITDFERIFRKGYRIIIATSLTALIFSFILVKTKPLNYRASTLIKYDTQSILSGLGSDAAMMAYDYLENITKVANDITSYPVMLRTAQKLNLISDTISTDIRNSNDSINAILQPLAALISTETNTSTNTISIVVNSRDPQQARDLANAVTYAFKEFSLERKKTQVLKTKKFIQNQLDRVQGELYEVETAIIDFEGKQRIPSINANANRIISQSDQLESNIDELQSRINVIEHQRIQLLNHQRSSSMDSTVNKRILTWLSEFIDDDPGLLQLNNRLISQQIERENQLAYYKADHPVILSLTTSINVTIERLVHELDKKESVLKEKLLLLDKNRRQIINEMSEIPRNEINYLRLKRTHNVKEEIYTMFSKRIQEINIAEAGILDDLIIVALAKIPQKPVNDDLIKAIGVGFFIGLILGLLIVILQELFDTSIGTIEDVEQSMKLPVIAVIPQIQQARKGTTFSSKKKGDGRNPIQSMLVTHFNPKEFGAEAFRILRTNIDFFWLEKQYQTYLFTSSSVNEGTSITAANISIAFAQQGKKTLLIEANLRRPALETMFGISQSNGISDILIEKVTWEQCVLTVTDLALGKMKLNEILSTPGLQNFYFIPHGHAPTNPTELLSSARMSQLLKTLKDEFDIIFIDAPPILPVADSIVLSKKVDGVVLIYKVGSVPRKTFQLCKERLDAVQANILGVVLNSLKPETAGPSYSKYTMKSYNTESSE